MPSAHPRMQREHKTIAAMIRIYCRGLHATRTGLCPACRELLAYADERLNKCLFQAGKTTCVKCPVHCYKPIMRERAAEVMRYAGPRMIYRHLWLALRHLLDGRRKKPLRPNDDS